MADTFNTNLRDSQSTVVLPIRPENFDFGAYREYEASLLEQNRRFVKSDQGLQIYRRVRADGVFYDKCRNYKESLELQLGALKAGMLYKADIANFLEPWYGIGYIASCFGSDYIWKEGQAPAVLPRFNSVNDLLASDYKPIHQTEVGKHILEMEEYFLDKTAGKLPMSFCDVQSPLNMLSYLLPISDLFLEIYDYPEEVAQAANLTAELLIEFLHKQQELIGSRLALPGHGFASSREFHGIGMSDDNSIMLQDENYTELFQPADEKIGDCFGGCAYHSCGNWANKIQMVKSFRNIKVADGAFSLQTDPTPNDPAVFGEKFAGSGIIVNARAVGNSADTYEIFRELLQPGQKLIAVTYCEDPKEQQELYDRLHALAERSVN